MIPRITIGQFSLLAVQGALDRFRLAVDQAISGAIGVHNTLAGRDAVGCHPPQAIATGMTTVDRLALVAPAGTIVWDTDEQVAYVWDGSAWSALGTSVHNDLVDRDAAGCHPPQAIATGMTTAARVALTPPDGTMVWDIELLRAFAWNGSAWTEV
jgi:hypothetical protein